MSKATESTDGSDLESYSPFKRVELTRGHVPLADLLSLFVVLVGLFFHGGLFGVAAWFVLLTCWATVRVEFAFGVGAVLFAGLTGAPNRFGDAVAVAIGSGLDIQLVGAVITLTGLSSLLANDLRRTWQSIHLVTVFTVLLSLSVAVLALTSQTIGLQLLSAVTIVILVLTSYLLHRYERGQQWRVKPNSEVTETDSPKNKDG